MPCDEKDLPTKPGSYVGRLGTIFRLSEGRHTLIWKRVDLFSTTYCPPSEVAMYGPLTEVDDKTAGCGQ